MRKPLPVPGPAPCTLSARVKLYRKYLDTHKGRFILAQSMICPAEKILNAPALTAADRQNGRRILRWGERVLGRAYLEGSPITEVQIGLTLDFLDFPALLRTLREKLASGSPTS